MSEIDPLSVFPIDYVDRKGQRRVFFVFPEPIQTRFRKQRREFLIRTDSSVPASGVDRFFQFDLEEEEDSCWRVDMIGQTSKYTEFGRCGLPDELILAVARRFGLTICSSTFEEMQMDKAKKVWERLKNRFDESPGDFRVEEAAGRFRLMPCEERKSR